MEILGVEELWLTVHLSYYNQCFKHCFINPNDVLENVKKFDMKHTEINKDRLNFVSLFCNSYCCYVNDKHKSLTNRKNDKTKIVNFKELN